MPSPWARSALSVNLSRFRPARETQIADANGPGGEALVVLAKSARPCRCSGVAMRQPRYLTLVHRCSVRSTISAVIEELRLAVDALTTGNAEPFLALIDEDSEWRGITSGHLWWKQAPS